MTPAQLESTFETMYATIGGRSNPDVKWYLTSRPKSISRNSFFEQTVWAIWVGGKSRDAAKSFMQRAELIGFVWNFQDFASWDEGRLSQFMERLHGTPVPKRAAEMWGTIHDVAKQLANYHTERAFQRSCFGGKSKSAELDETDVQRIMNIGIKFVGEANANFIIRNMGGETIKCDRWIKEFIRHFGWTTDKLKQQLRKIEIRPGLFDVVLWSYCEKIIVNVRKFAKHFNGLLSASIDNAEKASGVAR